MKFLRKNPNLKQEAHGPHVSDLDMILVLCKFSDHALNLYQVSRKYLELSKSYGINAISKLKIQRIKSAKLPDGVMALIFCIPSDVASYLFKDYENFYDSSVLEQTQISYKIFLKKIILKKMWGSCSLHIVR